MPGPVPTYVYSSDSISQAGLISQLRHRPEIRIVEPQDIEDAVVAVVIADTVTDEVLRVLKAIQRNSVPRTVLIASLIDDATLVSAAEAGICGLIRRSDASPENLARTLQRIAAGDGTVPGDLVGRLLAQVGRLQREVLTPRGMSFSGLSERETRVLTLVADGDDTATIAQRLSYSERTVKNILHEINSRLQLRNRSHAVAYAVREGLI